MVYTCLTQRWVVLLEVKVFAGSCNPGLSPRRDLLPCPCLTPPPPECADSEMWSLGKLVTRAPNRCSDKRRAGPCLREMDDFG